MRKLSDKELMKRKFKKFLYDNDALTEWTRLRAKDSESNAKFWRREPEQWISRAFIWGWNDDTYEKWERLAVKWNELLRINVGCEPVCLILF